MAGVAVVRVSGPQAWAVVLGLFVPAGKRPLVAGRARLGQLVDGTGRELDRCLLLPFRAPHSYTGEDVCELHLHGSPYIVEEALALLGQQCRAAEPGEFTRRALLNGKLDLAQAEGVRALIESRSALAHRLAQRALSGEDSRRVEDLRLTLIDVLSRVEAELDFLPRGGGTAARHPAAGTSGPGAAAGRDLVGQLSHRAPGPGCGRGAGQAHPTRASPP
jgi:tRNA modification GTPase